MIFQAYIQEIIIFMLLDSKRKQYIKQYFIFLISEEISQRSSKHCNFKDRFQLENTLK